MSHYYELVHKDLEAKNKLYNDVRFPVSLEIKDENVKNFYIAKLYRLSEKFKMPNMMAVYEKMKAIKNQILLSIESMRKKIENQRLKSC